MLTIAVAMLAAADGLPATKVVHGDFDRDGRRDIAELVNRAGGHMLEVRLAGREQIRLLGQISNPRYFYVELAPEGTRPTACAKGLGPDRPCDRKSVTVKGDVLQFGTEEASEAVAIWNGRSFEIVWTGD